MSSLGLQADEAATALRVLEQGQAQTGTREHQSGESLGIIAGRASADLDADLVGQQQRGLHAAAAAVVERGDPGSGPGQREAARQAQQAADLDIGLQAERDQLAPLGAEVQRDAWRV